MQTNYILIVTDSRKLNESLGGYSNAWEAMIRPQLKTLYEWRAEGCMGVPIFLDLAELYPTGGYFWPQVGAAIRDFVTTEMEGLLPGAIAIIGGPDVVPMGELSNPADDDTLYTDDLHADFDRDNLHLPDVPITRLPEGHDIDLFNNYREAFGSNKTPPAGSTVYASLELSLERTRAGYTGFPVLSQIFAYGDRRGEFTHLLSPPWSGAQHNLEAVSGAESLLAGNDSWNYGAALPYPPLNVQYLLIMLGHGADNSTWYATHPTTGQPLAAFDVATVKNIPGEGEWHVFSLTGYAGKFDRGDQTPDNSIPLRFLYRGAHHFIGSTTNPYFVWEDCQNLGLAVPVCHYGLTANTGLFTQLYYRTYSPDPATAFWSAKDTFARQMDPNSPYDRKTLHSFHYFGLPEPGPNLGTLQALGFYSDETLRAGSPIRCPSGNPDDCDGDGLSEKEENWVANTFVPVYHLAVNDKVRPRAFIYQVSPRQNARGQTVVVLTIGTLFDLDYVVTTSGARRFMHFGDDEAIEVWLLRQEGTTWSLSLNQFVSAIYQEEGSPTLYMVDRVVMHRHAHGHEYQIFDLKWEDNTHPLVYVSEGKHGTYSSPKECNNYPSADWWKIWKKGWWEEEVWHEVCSDKEEARLWGTYLKPFLSTVLNVGEKSIHPYGDWREASGALFTDTSENPSLAGLFPNEKVWGDQDLRFCGGYRNRVLDAVFKYEPNLIEFCMNIQPFLSSPLDPNVEACYPTGGLWLLFNEIFATRRFALDRTKENGAMEAMTSIAVMTENCLNRSRFAKEASI